MGAETDLLVVYCTASPEEADALARALVQERLAACVNIAPVRSCYIWEGKLSLNEYLDRVVFHDPRPFSREAFKDFMFAQSKAFPDMIELVRRLKARYRLKLLKPSRDDGFRHGKIVFEILNVAAQELERYAAQVAPAQLFLELG